MKTRPDYDPADLDVNNPSPTAKGPTDNAPGSATENSPGIKGGRADRPATRGGDGQKSTK